MNALSRVDRRALAAVGLISAIVLAAAIVYAKLGADATARLSDEELIALARDTREARAFDAVTGGGGVATVDRSGRTAVDLRATMGGRTVRLRAFVAGYGRVDGFLLDCPGGRIVTASALRSPDIECAP